MTQSDDQNFSITLNNFANCCMSENDIDLFMSRIIGKDSIENLPIKSIHLFSTNASVNAHNETVLNALSTEGCRFIAIDSLVGDSAGGITDKLREVLKQLKVSDNQGLPYDLQACQKVPSLKVRSGQVRSYWKILAIRSGQVMCPKHSIQVRSAPSGQVRFLEFTVT